MTKKLAASCHLHRENFLPSCIVNITISSTILHQVANEASVTSVYSKCSALPSRILFRGKAT